MGTFSILRQRAGVVAMHTAPCWGFWGRRLRQGTTIRMVDKKRTFARKLKVIRCPWEAGKWALDTGGQRRHSSSGQGAGQASVKAGALPVWMVSSVRVERLGELVEMGLSSTILRDTGDGWGPVLGGGGREEDEGVRTGCPWKAGMVGPAPRSGWQVTVWARAESAEGMDGDP